MDKYKIIFKKFQQLCLYQYISDFAGILGSNEI